MLGHGQRDLRTADLLKLVSRQWEVFHVIVEEGSHCRSGNLGRVARKWTGLLGQRALRLRDHTRLPEVIVSAMQVNEGADVGDVAGSWGGGTAAVVRHALGAPRPGLMRLLGR